MSRTETMRPRHLMFLFVDHFEPRDAAAVEAWTRQYPEMARRHRDADGRPPRHTWFYDSDDARVLDRLAGLCRQGLGEVELHLHHGNDTADSLTERIEQRKESFHQSGALITATGQRTFGFIHGKWSLDNSRGDAHCGVNNELQVLRRTGCYADFTFPAWGRMQPHKVNSIYYATDDPAAPKSYDTGVDVQVGRDPSGDLMIFQGPGARSGLPERIGKWRLVRAPLERFFLTCNITYYSPWSPKRMARWVAAHVHVRGRPEWTFIKVHTHGAREKNFDAYFGRGADAMCDGLESLYNDREQWSLHYVTAREAHNIVKAAEAGQTGDPGQYRDFAISPYQNT